jgi:hypothetical protein
MTGRHRHTAFAGSAVDDVRVDGAWGGTGVMRCALMWIVVREDGAHRQPLPGPST